LLSTSTKNTLKMSIKVIAKLSDSDRKSLKNGVIQVTGKAMNRTAIGVVDALITLYPKATFEELKAMIPDSLNPSAPKNYKSLFKPYTERNYGVIQPGSIRQECIDQQLEIHAGHFVEKEEVFKSADGVEVLVSKSWESKDTETGESDIQNLINHVAQYGVKVVQVEKKEAFNKGDYNLEIINPELKKAIEKASNKKNPWWLIAILVGLAIGVYLVVKK
jgi:hypothetical protein